MFNNIIYYIVLINMILGISICVYVYVCKYVNKILVKRKLGRGKMLMS